VTALARCGHNVGVPPIGVEHALTASPADDCFDLQTAVEAGLRFGDRVIVRTVEVR
jgi:hypothetical protein